MFALLRSGLRHRAAALLAIVIAAALGSALVVVCGAMLETGVRLAAPPERIGAADLVVIGDPDYTMLDSDGRRTTDLRPLPERRRLTDDAVEATASAPGVAGAVPIFFTDALVAGAGAPAGGVVLPAQNAASAVLGGLPGVGVLADDEVVLTTAAASALGAAPGSSITMTIAGRRMTARVVSVVGAGAVPATLYIADAVLPGGPDAIGVVLAEGADPRAVGEGISHALSVIRILEGEGRGAAENPAVSSARIPTIVIGAVFGGIVLVVLATVVSGVVALAVRQRSREISLLRATGATGRQVRALLVGEALVAGAAGVVLGLAGGAPLAALLFIAMRTVHLVPGILQLRVGPVPFGVAALAPLLVVWLAAWSAARAARRARAVDALREAEVPRGRVGAVRAILGVVFALGAVALGIITCAMPPALLAATAGPAVLAAAISAALLAPAHLWIALWITAPLRGPRHGIGALAARGVRARSAAFGTITGATALVVALGVGNLAPQAMAASAAGRAQVAGITAQVVVDGGAGIDPDVERVVRSVPGVGAVSAFVSSGGWIEKPFDGSHPDRPWPVRGVDGAGASAVLGNRVVSGDLAGLVGKTIALPARTAEELRIGVGDAVRFRFGDGAGAELRVVATYDDRPGYESLILPADLLGAHTTARTARMVLVASADGSRGVSLAASVRAALAGSPGVEVGDRSGLEDSLRAGLGVNAFVNILMLLVVLAYAMIAVVNTVAVSTLGRRRELALLRLAGARRGQVRRILGIETALAALAGIGAGLGAACVAIIPAAIVVGPADAGPTVVGILLGVLLAVGAITLPITDFAARRAMAAAPAEIVSGS